MTGWPTSGSSSRTRRIGMLLATINSSIILIALDIFRRIHLDPLTPANTNYLLRTTACLLVGSGRDITHTWHGRVFGNVPSKDAGSNDDERPVTANVRT